MAGKKARGKRANTRAKITSRGKATVNELLRTFEAGEKVQIYIHGGIHRGMPFRRFHGLTGDVTGMQGRAVVIKVNLGNQICEVVANPIHVKGITHNE